MDGRQTKASTVRRMRHSAQLAAVKTRCLFSLVNCVNPERSTIPRMLAFSRSKWTAMTGYAVAAAGMILFTQLDRVENWRMGQCS
jgi:hypothetical protein